MAKGKGKDGGDNWPLTCWAIMLQAMAASHGRGMGSKKGHLTEMPFSDTSITLLLEFAPNRAELTCRLNGNTGLRKESCRIRETARRDLHLGCSNIVEV